MTSPTGSTEQLINFLLPFTIIVVLRLALIADALALRVTTILLAIAALDECLSAGGTEGDAGLSAPVVQRTGVDSHEAGKTVVCSVEHGSNLREKNKLPGILISLQTHCELRKGMRRGELLGLEWRDIDFDNRTINIYRSSLYLPSKGIFEDETKNRTSERVIKCSEAVFDTLQSFRAWQNEQRLKAADQWHNTGRLFTTWDGKPLHPDTLSGWFRDFVKRNGLPDVSIHSLRHTNATLQIAGGVPVTTVSNRLGHATPSTTTRIYALAIKSADEAAADTLQNILVPSKNRNKTG